jgi:hypothetical protein
MQSFKTFITEAKNTYYRCGGCDAYHSTNWDGDCRDDASRLNPEDLDKKHGPTGWHEVDDPDWTSGSPRRFQKGGVTKEGLQQEDYVKSYKKSDPVNCMVCKGSPRFSNRAALKSHFDKEHTRFPSAAQAKKEQGIKEDLQEAKYQGGRRKYKPGRCRDCGHDKPVTRVNFWVNNMPYDVCSDCIKPYRGVILHPDRGPKKTNEENLNEISKPTLGRYINKATHDIGTTGVSYGSRERPDVLKIHNFWSSKSIKKREKGIGRAVTRFKDDLYPMRIPKLE